MRHHSRLCICRLCWRQTLVASRSCSIHLGRGEKWRPGGGCCGRRWVTDDPKRQTRYPGAPPRTQKSTFSAPGRSARGSLRMPATRGLAAGISEASGGHRDQAPAGWVGEPRGGGSRAASAAPFPRSRRPRTPAGCPAHPRWPLRAPPPSPPRSERGRGTRGARGWAGSECPASPPPPVDPAAAAHPGWRGRSRPGAGRSRCRGYLHLGGGRGGGPGAEARRGEGGRWRSRSGGRLGRLGPELAASGRRRGRTNTSRARGAGLAARTARTARTAARRPPSRRRGAAPSPPPAAGAEPRARRARPRAPGGAAAPGARVRAGDMGAD